MDDSQDAADDAPARILARWAVLVAEYEALRDALRAFVRQPHWPGVGPYVAMLKAEAAVAERQLRPLLLTDGAEPDGAEPDRADSAEEAAPSDGARASVVRLAATNLAAKEAMWRIVKRCRGVLALDRRFPVGGTDGEDSTTLSGGGGSEIESGTRTDGVFVNAVVDDGRTWLRVLTTTPRHLLFEMAELGWEEEDDQNEEENDGPLETSALADLSLVRTALDLARAARANRYRGAYPRVCILLTRIGDGGGGDRRADEAIGRLLARVRRGLAVYGAAQKPDVDGQTLVVEVCYGTHGDAGGGLLDGPTARPPPPLDVALRRLMPAHALVDRLTPTVNVDVSVLIALVSDMTHAAVRPEPWHTQQRVSEIRHEQRQPGQVLRTLCDALRGRRLVCTREAAAVFRTMVGRMGQASEQARAALLVGGEVDDTEAADDRLARFRARSLYAAAIPDDLRLPVAVVAEDWDVRRIYAAVDAGALPAVARPVADAVAAASDVSASSPTSSSSAAISATLTLAVFFYGWATGHTTVTANVAAKNRVARLVERFRTTSNERGPSVWSLRVMRSLNATRPRRPS